MSLAAPLTTAPRAAEHRTPETGPLSVVDLFSGAGGMSAGFQRHPEFAVVGAADAQVGKPSSGRGTLDCNASFAENVGVEPVGLDLGLADPDLMGEALGLAANPVVLSACAPCTGFSRTLARNHVVDDPRNSLVARVADFARALQPQVIVMENARELLMGRFAGHYASLHEGLTRLGYTITAEVHFLSAFGLAQRRERALIVAVRDGLPALGMGDLWAGRGVRSEALTVRHAIGGLPAVAAGVEHPHDPMHVSPNIAHDINRRRFRALPPDGGSWVDLVEHEAADELLTPSMKQRVARGDFGSHPDVYGRLRWDSPAATIKRECGHMGNGRYSHPEQDRLCTVRELALLQGFPRDYTFVSRSLANRYRHVGDAVPPLIAYQLAGLVSWILGGRRPEPEEMVLAGCSLTADDLVTR